MLNIFTLNNGRLASIQPDEVATRKPIWVDAIAPGEDERKWVAKAFSVILPQPEHLRDIEASARFYEENDELHLRSDFLLGKESDSRSVTVAFVLSDNMLFSVHDEDTPVFQHFRLHTHGQPDPIADSLDVLVDLYGPDLEFSADALVERLAAHRFEFDRREYQPHVTLLRNARWSDVPKADHPQPASGRAELTPLLPAMQPVCWKIKKFALVQSVPGDGLRDYLVLARFPLRARGG